MGYLLAFLTSLIFAAYVLPRKFATTRPFAYTAAVSIGVLAIGVAGWGLGLLGLGPGVRIVSVAAALPLGAFWALGSVLLVLAIDRIGISRSNQWKNLQGPIGVVLALLLMGELAKADLLQVVFGAVLVFGSALALNVPTEGGEETRSSDRRGVWLALGSALVFGIAAAYTKAFATGADTPSLAFGASIGFAAVAWLAALVTKQAREALTSGSHELGLALLGGAIFASSIWCMALTFRYLPVSVGYTIIQLNTVWVVLVGVLWFKEIRVAEHGARILLGLVLAVMGVLVLLVG